MNYQRIGRFLARTILVPVVALVHGLSAAPAVLDHHYVTEPTTDIHVLFDQDMVAATLNSTNVTVVGSVSGPVAVTLAYDEASRELTIDPAPALLHGEAIDVTLSSSIRSTDGEGMAADYAFNFSIQDAPGVTPIKWKAPVDGDWNDATKWDKGRKPGVNDMVIIDAAGADYTVSMHEWPNVLGLTIDSPDAELYMAGYTITVDGPSELRSGLFRSGNIDGNGTVSVTGEFMFEGTVNIHSPFQIMGTGRAVVTGSSGSSNGRLTSGNSFRNDGEVVLTHTLAGYEARIGAGGGRFMTNTASGRILLEPGTAAGPRTLGGSTLNQGVLDIQTDLTLENDDGVYINSGTIDVAAGKVLKCDSDAQRFEHRSGDINAPGGALFEIEGDAAGASFHWDGGSLNGGVLIDDAQISIGESIDGGTVTCERSCRLRGDLPAGAEIVLSGRNNPCFLDVDAGFANYGKLVMGRIGTSSTYLRSVGDNFSNVGELLLEDAGGGLVFIQDAFVNEPGGVIECGQLLILANNDAEYVNRGTFTVAPWAICRVDGRNQVFRQEAGSLGIGVGSEFKVQNSGVIARLQIDGGAVSGVPVVDNAHVGFGSSATAATVNLQSSCTLVSDVPETVHLVLSEAGGTVDCSQIGDVECAGTITCESPGSYSTYLGSTGRLLALTETGRLNLERGAGGTRYIRCNLSTAGTVNVKGIALADAEGQEVIQKETGNWNVVASGAFELKGRNQVFELRGGSLEVEGGFTVENSSGLSTYRQSGGAAVIEGRLVVRKTGNTARMELEGGTLTGTGKAIIEQAEIDFGPGMGEVTLHVQKAGFLVSDVPATAKLIVDPVAGAYLRSASGFRNDGEIHIAGDTGHQAYVSVGGTGIDNRGLIEIHAGDGEKDLRGSLRNNGGTVRLLENVYLDNFEATYTHNAGLIHIAPGKEFEVNGGSQVFSQNGGTLDCRGTFIVRGATGTAKATFGLAGGVVQGNAPQLDNVELNLAPTAPECTLILTRTCKPLTAIPAMVTVNLEAVSNNAYLYGDNLVNNGTVNLGTGGTNQAIIDNNAGAFTNNGTVNFLAGGTRTIWGSWTNTATGTMTCTMDVQMPSSGAVYRNAGQINVPAGGKLRIESVNQEFNMEGGTLDVDGQFRFEGGNANTFNYEAGAIDGVVDIEDATIILGPNAGPGYLRAVSTCKLEGDIPAGVTVEVSSDNSGGATLTGNSDVEIQQGGTLRLDSLGSGYFSRLHLTVGKVVNKGEIIAAAGGTGPRKIDAPLDNQGTLTVHRDLEILGPEVTSSGQVVITESVVLDVTNAPYVQTDGTLSLIGGAIRVPQDYRLASGRLQGSGRVTGTLVNSDTVRVGSSPGYLQIMGDYIQEPGATLEIGIEGGDPSQFDRLRVNLAADLAGTVLFSLPGPYVPSPGDAFEFMTYQSHVGELTPHPQQLAGSFVNLEHGPGGVSVLFEKPTLTVQSLPDDGIGITVTPTDLDGFGDGSTAFVRTYDIGEVVSLTAPETTDSTYFQRWEDDQGTELGSDTLLTLAMDAPATAVAVYADKHSFGGTISYSGRQPGEVIVQLRDDSGNVLSQQVGTPVRSGSSVTYLFDGLLPGDYLVAAWRDSNSNGTADLLEASGRTDLLTLPPDPIADFELADTNDDGDALPDWWEILHFGSTEAEDENGDYDGDTETNGGEYANDTDPADARSAHDPANEYTGFELYLQTLSFLAADRSIEFDRAGFNAGLIVPRPAERFAAAVLHKPEGAQGDNPLTLDVYGDGIAAGQAVNYDTVEAMIPEIPSGTYRFEAEFADTGREARYLRLKVELGTYDENSFPENPIVEFPAPGETGVSLTPLIDLQTDAWHSLRISGAGTEYNHTKDAGDVPPDTHQVPPSAALDGPIPYSLLVFNTSDDGVFLSTTASSFTTLDPDVRVASMLPGTPAGIGTPSATVGAEIAFTENSQQQFTVSAEGGRKPYQYQWTWGGETIGGDAPDLTYMATFDDVDHPDRRSPAIEVVCIITDSQGRAVASAMWQDVRIDDVDRPPMGAELIISPQDPVTGDDIEVEAAAEPDDPDGDPILGSLFAWEGPTRVRVPGPKLPKDRTKKGETWTAYLEVNTDPYNQGTVTTREDSIEATIANTPPTAEAQPTAATPADTVTTIQLGGEDPDVSEGVDDLDFVIETPPANGQIKSIDGENGLMEYEPAPGFTGMDSFSFTVTDGDDTSSPAQVAVYVHAGWLLKLEAAEVDITPLYIGREPGATDGQDDVDVTMTEAPPGLDQPYAGLPNVGFTLQRDIRGTDGRTEWPLLVVPGGKQVQVSWDPIDVPEGGLIIWEVDDEGHPDFSTAIDMSREPSVTVNPDEPAKTFAISATLRQDYDLSAGYNLIGLPFAPLEPDPTVAFATGRRRDDPPIFDGGPWTLDPATGALKSAGRLNAGRAYWLYLSAPAATTVLGTPGEDPDTTPGRWNAVAFPSTSVPPGRRSDSGWKWLFDSLRQEFTQHLPGETIPLGMGCFYYPTAE